MDLQRGSHRSFSLRSEMRNGSSQGSDLVGSRGGGHCREQAVHREELIDAPGHQGFGLRRRINYDRGSRRVGAGAKALDGDWRGHVRLTGHSAKNCEAS